MSLDKVTSGRKLPPIAKGSDSMLSYPSRSHYSCAARSWSWLRSSVTNKSGWQALSERPIRECRTVHSDILWNWWRRNVLFWKSLAISKSRCSRPQIPRSTAIMSCLRSIQKPYCFLDLSTIFVPDYSPYTKLFSSKTASMSAHNHKYDYVSSHSNLKACNLPIWLHE